MRRLSSAVSGKSPFASALFTSVICSALAAAFLSFALDSTSLAQGGFFLLAAAGCGWLALANLAVVLMRIYSLLPGKKRRAKNAADREMRQMAEAMLTIAAEIAYAGKTQIEPEERAAIVRSVRRIEGSQALGDDEEIIAEFERCSSRIWDIGQAKRIAPENRVPVLMSAIEIAAAAPRFLQAQEEAIIRIGATMGFEEASVAELLRATKDYSSHDRASHSYSEYEQSGGDRTYIPGTIRHALDVLELPPTATLAQVKKQYKRLAMATHPDRADPSQRDAATERFKMIGDAYKLLREQLQA